MAPPSEPAPTTPDRRRPRTFARDVRGSIVTVAAVALPALCMCAFGAIELAEVTRAKVQLQSFVDTAAMSGAREFNADQSDATVERARFTADALAEPLRARWSVATTAQADAKAGAMTVSQQAVRPSFFGSLLPPGGFHLSATATATANSKLPLCVIGLRSGGQQVVSLQGSATLAASGCLVQSDSDLVAAGGASVQAGAVRTVGAASGNITPSPLTDAPPVPDPFTALPINVPTLCTDFPMQLLGGTLTLKPGRHCNGLQLVGSSTLVLEPGEHYFTGGGLSFLGNTTITGTDVTLIFQDASSVAFGGNATLSLEGRKSGPYAGFVLVTDRSFTGTFEISAKNAKKLLGTVYLPNATLEISGQGNKVADQSAWTVVVAKQLAVKGSASLVINANYKSATVPVPTGVGPLGTRLVN